MSPPLTVLMPVYNTAPYLREATDSILRQTFADFELLAIDDGSTDESVAILQSYTDPRLRIVRNERNLGLIATLNKGLDLIQSPYIARMDSDDISLPERFAVQTDYLRRHPHVGILGSCNHIFGESVRTRYRTPPHAPAQIRMYSLIDWPILHPTVMMQTSFLKKHQLRFRAEYPHAEDYDFFARAARCFPMVNLPESLLLYRAHAAQVSARFREVQDASALRVVGDVCRAYGYDPAAEDLLRYRRLTTGYWANDPQFIADGQRFLKQFIARLQFRDPEDAAAAEVQFQVLFKRMHRFAHSPTQRFLRVAKRVLGRS